MKRLLLISILWVNIIVIICASCSPHYKKEVAIEKYPSDTLDVYKPLIPIDSLDFSLSYQGIPIAQTKDRFATENSDIYINMDIVILEQNPKITSNLLSFAIFNLSNLGFTHTPDSLIYDKYDLGYLGLPTQEMINVFSEVASKEFYEELPTILSYECGFNMDIEIYPVFLNDDYVTYCKYAYYYTGGAHGNYSKFLQTYNLKTGDSVDLEDIIKPDKLGEFRNVVVKHMASSYPHSSNSQPVNEYLDSLNGWKGATNLGVVFGSVSPDDLEKITIDNYPLNDPGITEVGLVISYEKYFLTSGVYGCPTIVIPFDEIKNCLKPRFNQYKTIIPLQSSTNSKIGTEVENPGWYYTSEDIDSIRSTMGLNDYGKPFPNDINEYYNYRHGEIRNYYSDMDIQGEWIIYGHLYDPRRCLTFSPDGKFIEISQYALNKDAYGNMHYYHKGRIEGIYSYDRSKNLITLYNYENLMSIPLEGFLKYEHPENLRYVIHKIENDTIWLADEVGDIWPGFRPWVKLNGVKNNISVK